VEDQYRQFKFRVNEACSIKEKEAFPLMVCDTILLSHSDVLDLFTMANCVRSQEEVFKAHRNNKAWNGKSGGIFPNNKIMNHPLFARIICGGIEPDWFGIKMAALGEGSSKERPRMYLLSLFKSIDLYPRAIIEGEHISNARTGAVSAVATKYLARKDAKIIGILGAGAVARQSLLAHHCIEWPVKKVLVYCRSPQLRNEFASTMETQTGYVIEPRSDAKSVVKEAEILITATNSYEPIFESKWVQPGTHLNAMGQALEIDPHLLLRSIIIVDDMHEATTVGKTSKGIQEGFITEESVCSTLGDLLTEKKFVRSNDNDITVFDSSGLCMQDIACGIELLQLAQKRGIGDITTKLAYSN